MSTFNIPVDEGDESYIMYQENGTEQSIMVIKNDNYLYLYQENDCVCIHKDSFKEFSNLIKKAIT